MARYDITKKHAPGITSNPMIGMAAGMPAAQAVAMAGGMIGSDAVSAITDEVTSLE